jgi:hypothetical protein
MNDQNPILKIIYICVAFIVEIAAYALLVGLCIQITQQTHGSISSISEGLALSTGITSYYIFIIYVFAIGRNGYEFYIDPYDRLHAWINNKGLYAAIVLRIIFLNILMLFLMLIGAMPTNRDQNLHNAFAFTAVISHLVYEFICIGIRSYYASVNNLEIVKSLPAYIFLICLEAAMVIVAVMYALCFISIFDTCPRNSEIGFVSEYLLFATVIATPIFRILD